MSIEVVDSRQIRAVRAALGMSLSEMAEAAKINRNSVRAAESCADIKRHRLAATAIAMVGLNRGIFCEMEDGAPVVRFG